MSTNIERSWGNYEEITNRPQKSNLTRRYKCNPETPKGCKSKGNFLKSDINSVVPQVETSCAFTVGNNRVMWQNRMRIFARV